MSLSDPSQWLPVEVMSRIFAFSRNQHRNGHLYLCAVCKRWRTIVCSNPELWTKFLFDSPRRDCRFINDAASQWLARSGALPLDVYIDLSLRTVILPEDFSPMFDLLGKCVGRCRILTLKGFKINDFALVFNPKIECHPWTESDSILDKLRLGFSAEHRIERRRSKSEPYLLDISRHRPSKITLSGVFPSQLRINWGELTCVRLYSTFGVESCLVLEELLDLLDAAPQLTSCWVEELGGYGDRDSPRFHSSHHLVHRFLSHFTITAHDSEPSSVESLFSAITLPSLRNLFISSDCIHFPGNVMNSFLRRSGCRLHDLTARLLVDSENEEDFIHFLEASPHITSLDLTSVTDRFLDLLAMKPENEGDDPLFLPSLDCLDYRGPRTFSWQAFEQILWRIEAVASRAKEHADLAGPFYLCLTSEPEILSESLTRWVATMPEDLLFSIYSAYPVKTEGSWVTRSLSHWGIKSRG